jgi:peptidoglycan/xylan/chitin deacetylase (PgdA/CDA1 family)
LVGRRAAEHADLVRRIVDEGHAVGHHTYTHSDPAATSAGQLAAEIDRTGKVLTEAIGFSPRLFRPPHGRLTPAKLWRLWRIGVSVALWNVDPRDFACGSAAELQDRLLARDPRAGDVYLFHDLSPAFGRRA